MAQRAFSRTGHATVAAASRWLLLVVAVAALAVAALMLPAAAMAGAIVTPAGYATNAITRGDDTTNLVVNLPFAMNWAGTNYTQIYLNMNGNVTFGSAFASYDPNPTLSSLNRPIMAPFWADVDTLNTSTAQMTYSNITSGSVPMIDGHRAFIVNWIGVARYNSQATPLNSFQLVLIDRSDTGVGNFDFEYNYDTITWDRGTASSTGYARAGWARAGGTAFELPGGNTSGRMLDTGANALIDGTLNSGGVLGRYVWQMRNGAPGNSAPIISMGFATTTLQANTGGATPGYAGYDGAGDATAADPDGSVVSFVRSPAAGTFLPMGSTTVTWTATDNSGAVSTASQTIVVVDDTPPSLPTLSSPTHAVSTWYTSLGSIGIDWTNSVDANTGVGGYSYAWTANAPGLPNTTTDAYTAGSTLTPTLENQSFPNNTWPADWLRPAGDSQTYIRANNARNHGTFAAEAWSNGNTRRTVQFSKTYDLSGYSSAALSFWDYSVQLDTNGDYNLVEYSTNGTTWTTLQNRNTNVGWTQRPYVIPTGSSTTTIRFTGSVNANNEFVDWDDILLTAVRVIPNHIAEDPGDGRWYFNIRAVDGVGNWTATAASLGPFWIDRVAPVTSDDLPAGWMTSQNTVTLTPTDGSGSGIANTVYWLDGGAMSTYTTPLTIPTEGSHAIQYRSTDVAGNKESTKTVTFLVDRTAPTIPTLPTASAASTTTIDLTWIGSTDGASGVAYYAIYRDGSLEATTTSTNFTSSGLTPGATYTYTIQAVDAAGNRSGQSVPVGEQVPDMALRLEISAPGIDFDSLMPGLPVTKPDATTVSVSGVGAIGYQLSCAAADLSDVDTASPAPPIPVGSMSFVTRGFCTAAQQAFSATPLVVDTATGVSHHWTHDYFFDYTMSVSWAVDPGSYTTTVVYTVVSN